MIIERWYRHFAKSVVWRIIASTTTALIALIMTGSMAVAGSIASIGFFVKWALNYLHEWIWSKNNFGRELVEKPGVTIWLTGLSGAGKTTVADAVAEELRKRLVPVARLDGDVARRTFSKDLGFTAEDRAENCRRAATVASYLQENHIVLASFISPTVDIRYAVKEMCNPLFVYLSTPLEECRRRDPKKMYRMLEDGKFKGEPFTGVHPEAPYEELQPHECSIRIDTSKMTLDECVEVVMTLLKDYL